MLKADEIREIIELIDQSTINEFSYEADGSKLKIKKTTVHNNLQVVKEATSPEPLVEEVNTQQNVIVEEDTSDTADQVTVDATTQEIVSPMVGTFYRKPSPESDNYVEIGDKVEETTVVCIVEAMKLFNEIEAEKTGEIVEILVEDGELVEYGQPLFKVKA